MKIRIKRIYEPYSDKDGYRVLVDRLWPRGITKKRARLTSWMKEIAPSKELRQWFSHDPEKWKMFRVRYLFELAQHAAEITKLITLAKENTLTLVYAARDESHNHARVLADYLEHIKTNAAK